MLLWLFFSATDFCYASSPQDSLITKLNAIRSLQANFQESIIADDHHIIKTSGHMLLVRPGHFRWETQHPRQLVLADGRQVWIYDVELEQVTVSPQAKALKGTPALFLSDATAQSLAQDYQMTHHLTTAQQETFELQALSKHAAFSHLWLVFVNQQLFSMQLMDRLGQKTLLRFDHVKQNIPISATQFVFKPPRGVDVIREPS